jgi:hypothetical protein
MHVTDREAAAMYARTCRAWYGQGLVDTTRLSMLVLMGAGSGACRDPRGERQQIRYRQACPEGPSFFRSPSAWSLPSV